MAIDSVADRRSALGMYVFDTGGLAAPGAPVLSVDHYSDTDIFISWAFGSLVANYQLWVKEGAGAYARYPDASTTFAGPTTSIASRTASTAYTIKVTATNDTGDTDSNEVTLTTAATTPILTRIKAAAATLIDGMTTAGGYNYNWGDSNIADMARKDAYPNAEIRVLDEESQDEVDAVHAYAYTNRVEMEIVVHSKATSAEATATASTPNFDIDAYHEKALDDLKELFGRNPHINDTCNFIYYQNRVTETTGNGDVRVPGKMTTRWMITYSQNRVSPAVNAN